MRVVPAKYSTLVMALLGEVALAVSVMGARAMLVAPLVGVSMVIVGGLLTVIAIGAPSTGAPSASMARGVIR